MIIGLDLAAAAGVDKACTITEQIYGSMIL